MKLILVNDEIKLFNEIQDALSVTINNDWVEKSGEDILIVDIPYEDTKPIIDALKGDIVPVIGVLSKWNNNHTFEVLMPMFLMISKLAKPELKDDIEILKNAFINISSNYVRSIFGRIVDDIRSKRAKKSGGSPSSFEETTAYVSRIQNEVEDDIITFNLPDTEEGIKARLMEVQKLLDDHTDENDKDLIMDIHDFNRLCKEKNALNVALMKIRK